MGFSTKFIILLLGAFAVSSVQAESVTDYTYLGQVSLEENKGVRAVTYHLSQKTLGQIQARVACETDLNGRLATILTKQEFDSLGGFLIAQGITTGHHWVAGEHDRSVWRWITTGDEILAEQFYHWNHNYGTIRPSLTFVPAPGNIGYNDAYYPSSNYKYICETS